MQYKDHYELLGIPRDASHTEVSLLKKKNETLGPLTKTHWLRVYIYICVCHRSVELIVNWPSSAIPTENRAPKR